MNKQEQLIEKIHHLTKTDKRNVIAIDGRSCSGKTTFALQLQSLFNCSIIHLDDFFLPKEKQLNILDEIAGNIDKERFLQEVINPLQIGQPFTYHKFDCKVNKFVEKIKVNKTNLIIIEGAYTLYPSFRSAYDLTVFMDVDEKVQFNRLVKREGKQGAKLFINKWIPKEEEYFRQKQVHLLSDFYLNTSCSEGE